MTISNKINPSEDLKKIWKLVPKNIEMEESPTRKAPALYAESSAFMVLFYLMMILAIGGDIYLASKILMKAGVSSLMVIISVIVDFFLAILSFILTLTFTEITCKNKVLQLELDSLCKIKGESENDRKTRKEENEKNLSKSRNSILICNIFKYLFYLLIFVIAGWKIKTFMDTVPYNIFETMKGKMVISVSLLDAIFHVLATEKVIIHIIYWFKRNSLITNAERTQDMNEPPHMDDLKIPYEGNFVPAKSGFTELVVNGDKSALINYAYIIRDEEINALISKNKDTNARRAIIETCKDFQLRK